MNVYRFLSFIFFTTSIIIILPKFSSSTWNFSFVDLPDDVPIWKFVFWRNRAFFAIPSFTRRERHLNSELTLLEACWPEPGNNYNGFVSTNAANKNVRIFSKSSIATSNRCEKLSSVVGLDVDPRGRLWILDSPEDNDCPAKIVIYDLKRNDLEIVRTDLLGIPKNNLKTLVIDPVLGVWGPKAYIGDPGDESIIVYSLMKKKWRRLRLVGDNAMPIFRPTEIAISRKNSLLYLTDSQSQDLYSVDLEISRNDENMKRNATIKWLGKKMGSSSGLAIDHKGGLHYFLVTEHASVRWDTRHDLKTSSYSILLQSDEVPCITDYRLDIQRNVWGLVNRENPFVKSSRSYFESNWNGQLRTVRIFKYQPLGS